METPDPAVQMLLALSAKLAAEKTGDSKSDAVTMAISGTLKTTADILQAESKKPRSPEMFMALAMLASAVGLLAEQQKRFVLHA